jgi:uncharacterized protein YkwD
VPANLLAAKGCSSSLLAALLIASLLLAPASAPLQAAPTGRLDPAPSLALRAGPLSSPRRPVPNALPPVAQPYTTSTYLWEPLILPPQVVSTTVGELAVHPADANTIFLPTWSGLYQSANAGAGWTRVAADTLSYVAQVLIAPSAPSRMYARSWELARSDDGGQHWAALPTPGSVCNLAVAPSDPDRLYAPVCGFDTAPVLYRSDDGGHTWITPTLVLTETIFSLAVAPQSPDVVVAGLNGQLLLSRNGGATWSPALAGYVSRFIFDPHPPHALFAVTWAGVLRSLDLGLTWQLSSLGRSVAALTISPFRPDELLFTDNAAGFNASVGGRLQVSPSDWRVQAWDIPAAVYALWSSPSDARVLYARDGLQLWRYVQHLQEVPYPVFLPFLRRPPDPPGVPSAAQQAVDRANQFRAAAGVGPLLLHPAIVTATEAHAQYHVLNVGDDAAWTYGPHGEVEGKPGFTGRWPSDRIQAAGFLWWGGSEIMHYVGDPLSAVDGWMATIFHRVILLDDRMHYAGYGARRPGHTAVDVMDFGGGPINSGLWTGAVPYPLAYPAHGQTGVPPLWDGGESPDPLPPGASRPVGYPFTLQGVGGSLTVTVAILRMAGGELVPVHPNPADCAAFNCYALIPIAPLQAGTGYFVEAAGSVGGVPFHRSFAFTTAPASSQAEFVAPAFHLGPALLPTQPMPSALPH